MAAPTLRHRFQEGNVMKSGSFVSENSLDGDQMQIAPATLPGRSDASMSTREGRYVVERREGSRSGDLRSFVAGRYMHMLRAHDRARLETLAAHSTQPR